MQLLKKSQKSSKARPFIHKEVITQTHILQWLTIKNIFHWRQNNIGLKGRPFVGIHGLPDILAVSPDGKFIGIECKRLKEKQTHDQKLFQARLEANNGIYILAYSLDDVISKVTEIL